MKIGVLIPATSKGHSWQTIKDTFLYKYSLTSFLLTRSEQYTYTFYIGIDRDDPVYDLPENKKHFERICSIMTGVSIEFMYMDNIPKGHLTVMWNVLFKKAYDDGCNYFIQCGDDIIFKTKGWIEAGINKLQTSSNIGVCGPLNNNPRIITQSLVSRKHMDIFKYYFPPEIINWFCDDWINEVYASQNKLYKLEEHFCINAGGQPRYDINNEVNYSSDQNEYKKSLHNMRDICSRIVRRDTIKLRRK
tara:strand:+ start:1622 stop:2362 length:741 start_codon:yes stop_codon:yes gene_type:complete